MGSPSLRARLGLLGLVSSLACLESKAFFDDDIPLDVVHVGAALVSDNGVVRRMSPLGTPSEMPVMARAEGDRVWYFGWSNRLSEAGLDLEALRSEPLIATPDCRAGLPRPNWNFEIPASGELGRLLSPEELPSGITHPSILAVCDPQGVLRPESAKPPELYANQSLENSCPGSLCTGTLELGADCRLNASLGRCVGQPQTGFLDRDRNACIEPGAGCRDLGPSREALLSLACQVGPEECIFRFHQPEAPVALSLERLPIAPPMSGPELELAPLRAPPYPRSFGRLQHLAVGAERVVALVRDDLSWSADCQDETERARLVELQAVPLAVAATGAPDLSCLRLLALDHEGTLFGVYGVYPELRVAAFNPDGTVARTRPISSSGPLAPGSYVPIDLVYDAESETLALALHAQNLELDDRLVFVSRDLGRVRTSTLAERQISSLRLGSNREGESRLVLAELTQSLALWWKPWEAQEESGAGLVNPFFRLPLIGAAPFRKGSVVGLFADTTPGMSRASSVSFGAFESFAFFEGTIDGTTLVEFPSEDETKERLYIAGRERVEGRLGSAVIAEYGYSHPRRMKAGARVIGEGVVLGGDRDAAGRAWLYLPWSGTVVRVDPPELTP